MFEILKQIWELPWYKVIAIAIMDDGILLLKTWWLWLGLIVLIVGLGILALRGK